MPVGVTAAVVGAVVTSSATAAIGSFAAAIAGAVAASAVDLCGATHIPRRTPAETRFRAAGDVVCPR